MGLLLFIVSIILGAVFFGISLVLTPIYYILTFKWKTGAKKLDRYFYLCALGVDQLGNVLTSQVLNKALLKGKPQYESLYFGNPDDTISYIIGQNKYGNNLTRIGKAIDWVLHKLDPYHVEKAILSKYVQGHEVVRDSKRPDYYRIIAMLNTKDGRIKDLVGEAIQEAHELTK
jgi:hypothetical protein